MHLKLSVVNSPKEFLRHIMMSYKDYFNRNKVIDNSYTCLHFTDNMKIRTIGSEMSAEESKVAIRKYLQTPI